MIGERVGAFEKEVWICLEFVCCCNFPVWKFDLVLEPRKSLFSGKVQG